MKEQLSLDLEEEVLLRLPLKSILKFKSVSKQWRSLLESRSFSEKRKRRIIITQKKQKKMQFVAALLIDLKYPEVAVDDEELEVIYLDCDFAKLPPSEEVKTLDSVCSRLPSLSCDGLVCMPVPGWINVLNPSTGEFLRFPSGRDPKITKVLEDISNRGFEVFPGYWRMGFGRDKVNGNYKVVRMFFEPNYYCQILDINIGEWKKLKSKPLFYVDERLKSAFVNGSIYWLEVDIDYLTQKILALDLHTEEFRSVRTPPRFCKSGQIANLQDRLVVAEASFGEPNFRFCIWSMDDAGEETWSITYSFPLPSTTFSDYISRCIHWGHWCMPLAVSKRGNLYFYDKEKKLNKYYSDTGLVRGITDGHPGGIRVVAPFVENLLPIQSSASSGQQIRTFGFQNLNKPETSNWFRQTKVSVSDVLQEEWLGITTAIVVVVALVVFLK